MLLTRTWGSNGRMLLQTIHFGFAFGGIISPLATAPFLAPDIQPITDHNTSLYYSNHSTVVSNSSQEKYYVHKSLFLYEIAVQTLHSLFNISIHGIFVCISDVIDDMSNTE